MEESADQSVKGENDIEIGIVSESEINHSLTTPSEDESEQSENFKHLSPRGTPRATNATGFRS